MFTRFSTEINEFQLLRWCLFVKMTNVHTVVWPLNFFSEAISFARKKKLKQKRKEELHYRERSVQVCKTFRPLNTFQNVNSDQETSMELVEKCQKKTFVSCKRVNLVTLSQ